MPNPISLPSSQTILVRTKFYDAGGNEVAAPGPITMDYPANLISITPDSGGDPSLFQLVSIGPAGAGIIRTYGARNSPQQVTFDTPLTVTAGPAVSGELVAVL